MPDAQPTSEQPAAKMTGLRLTESSGVDHPAHIEEGWMVMKARSPLPPDRLADILSAAETITKHDSGATNAAPPTAPPAGTGGPDSGPTPTDPYSACVRDAIETQGMTPEQAAQHCAAQNAAAQTAASAPAGATGGRMSATGTNVSKAGGGEMMNEQVEAIVKAKDDEIAALRLEVAKLQKSDADAPATDPGEELIAKALADHEVPEPIAKAILDSQRIAKQAQAEAQAERDRRVTAEYVEKARSFRSLSADPTKLGPVLKRLHEASAEDAAVVEEVLKAAEGAVRQSNLFAEVGSGASPTQTGSSMGQLEALAKAKAEAENIPFSKALDAVLDSPDARDAKAAYLADRNGGV